MVPSDVHSEDHGHHKRMVDLGLEAQKWKERANKLRVREEAADQRAAEAEQLATEAEALQKNAKLAKGACVRELKIKQLFSFVTGILFMAVVQASVAVFWVVYTR